LAVEAELMCTLRSTDDAKVATATAEIPGETPAGA
jgi:hypothetical protein